MPWIQATEAPGEKPSRYAVPKWLYIPDEQQMQFMKARRKETGQLREEVLGFQKVSGQQKDFDTARYFRDEAAELMKQFRGWDLAIDWVEGKGGMNDWRHSAASEQIAPYIDRAFSAMDLSNETKGQEG